VGRLPVLRNFRCIVRCSAVHRPDRGRLVGAAIAVHGHHRCRARADRPPASQLSVSRWTQLRLFRRVAFDHRRNWRSPHGRCRQRAQSHRDRRIFRSVNVIFPVRDRFESRFDPAPSARFDLQAQRRRRAQTRDLNPIRLRAQEEHARREESQDRRNQARRKRPGWLRHRCHHRLLLPPVLAAATRRPIRISHQRRKTTIVHATVEKREVIKVPAEHSHP